MVFLWIYLVGYQHPSPHNIVHVYAWACELEFCIFLHLSVFACAYILTVAPYLWIVTSNLHNYLCAAYDNYHTWKGEEFIGTHMPMSSTVSCRKRVLKDWEADETAIWGSLSITWRVAVKTSVLSAIRCSVQYS